jgi:hypothetical protein
MIELYEKVLPGEICEYLIDLFHTEEVDAQYTMFDQLEIPHEHDINEYLIDITKQVGKDYLAKYDKWNMTPTKHGIEGFRIKRYEPNQHSFPWHVDVGSVDNCRRYLAFLFYLNDSPAGTRFENFTIEPKQGNIMVFPPMWMFPHEGMMPHEHPKYIMSTYYFYVD